MAIEQHRMENICGIISTDSSRQGLHPDNRIVDLVSRVSLSRLLFISRLVEERKNET